jgi:hypothetical protein
MFVRDTKPQLSENTQTEGVLGKALSPTRSTPDQSTTVDVADPGVSDAWQTHGESLVI